MATIRKRVWKNGSGVTWAVLYSLDGKQTSAPFADETSAEKFRAAVDQFGALRAMEVWGIASVAPRKVHGQTLEEWLNKYIANRTGVAKSTLYDYRSYLRKDIVPSIGAIPLTELSRDDIAGWVQFLVSRGTPEKPVAGKTIANKHGFLSAALKAAVIAELIPSNPAAGTRLPTTERPDMVFLTKEEFAAVLESVTEYWRPMVRFLVASGARFGEVSALKPSDVNRTKGTVRIVRAWKRTYTVGGYEIGPPKTKKSRRTINVPKDVLDQLDYTGEWLFTNSGRGKGQFSNGTIADDGRPVRGRNFLRTVWNPAVQRAGLDPKPRVHDLRHTCASWLIQSGAPLPSIQAHLGHESIEVTVGVYGHLDRSSGEVLADVIGRALE